MVVVMDLWTTDYSRKRLPREERILQFERNWLCYSLRDSGSELYSPLQVFLEPLYDPTHCLWVWEKCRFMATHGLRHTLNVFRYATRLYYDVVHNLNNPYRDSEFLKNDADKACLIVSLWLHDWGMAGPEQPTFIHYMRGAPSEKERRENFLKALNETIEVANKNLGERIDKVENLEFPCSWVRPNHSLLSFFNITKAPERVQLDILERKLTLYDVALEDIGVICLFHNFPLEKLRVFGKEHLAGLCALLSFLDGCDENWQRLKNIKHVDELLSRGIREGDEVYERVDSTIHSEKFKRHLSSIGVSDEYIEKLGRVWDEGKIAEVLELVAALKISNGKDAEELLELEKEITFYKRSFVDQFEEHIDPKTYVKDVYFRNGEIILVLRHKLISDENPAVKKILEKIIRHLTEYGAGLEKLGLHFTEKSIRLWKPEDGSPENLEIQELGPFMPITQRIEENTLNGRWPTEKDFQRELVYFDKEESEEIEKVLESELGRCCLLYGPPSFRKSTFALRFGLYRRQRGDSVFYREVEEDEKWPQWEEYAGRVEPYDRENVLFIIDECQNSPDTIGRFVEKIKVSTKKAKFLFISRKISKHRFDNQRFNYFDKLEPRRAWKNPKQSFEGVIKQFCASNKIEEKQVGDVEKVIEICGCIFSVLGYLLEEVWDPQSEILCTIPKERIYEKINDDFLRTDLRTEVLTKFAAIHQFGEMPITPEGLDALDIDPRLDVFRELEKEGIVHRMTAKLTGKIYFKMCYDSAFAGLILETVDHMGLLKLRFPQFESIDEFTLAILKNHLCKVKRHTTLLLSSIYESGMQEIGEKLVRDENVIAALKDYVILIKSPILLWKFLTLLRRFKIKQSTERALISTFSEVSLVEWTRSMVERNALVENPHTVGVFLALLRKFRIRENDKGIILLKFSDDVLGKWARKIIENKNIHSFFFLLKELHSFNPEKALAFLEIVDPKEVARIFKQWMHERETPKNVSPLTGIVSYSARISKDFSREFLNQFTEIELLYLLNGSKEEIEGGKCNQIYAYARKCRFSRNAQTAFRLFLENNSKELPRFLSSLDLVHDGMLIRVSYWNHLVQNAYRQFFKYFLRDKLIEASLKDVTRFITQISEIKIRESWVGKDLAKEIVTLLRNLRVLGREAIDEKLEEGSLESIQSLINIGIELDIDDFVDYVKGKLEDPRLNLAEKIKESDLGNFGFFVWNVSSNPSLSRMCNRLVEEARLELTEKAKESGLYDIAVFLLGLHMSGYGQQEFFETVLAEGLNRKFAELGEKLALLGLCQSIKPDLAEQIEYSEIKSSISAYGPGLESWFGKRLRKWLEKRQKGYPRRGIPELVTFLIAVKGFRQIDEEKCLSFLRTTPDLKALVESIRETRMENEKLENLARDFLSWLPFEDLLK